MKEEAQEEVGEEREGGREAPSGTSGVVVPYATYTNLSLSFSFFLSRSMCVYVCVCVCVCACARVVGRLGYTTPARRRRFS